MIKIQGEGKSHDSLIGDAKSNQMIRIKDGSYSYQNQIGFQGLDFEAEEGESVCIMGPNGAGKSTLLKAVVGLYSLDEGTYDFCGQRIDAVFLKDRKKSGKLYQQIGFVFQNSEIQLFNTSVYDEIAFGPRNLGLAEEEVKERVEDCLYLLQIENLRDRIPYQLSGGEQKLVAIASILSSNPEVVIFDEPFNGLSRKHCRAVSEVIQKLRKAGKTIIISSHHFNQIKNLVDEIYIFSEGHTIVKKIATSDLKNMPEFGE